MSEHPRPDFAVGEVVWAYFPDTHKPNGTGKIRPAILVAERRQGCYFDALRLTTNTKFAKGEQRTNLLPCLRAEGLKAGFLWSNRLVSVPRIDLISHAGWAAPSLVGVLEQETDLAPLLLAVLRNRLALAPLHSQPMRSQLGRAARDRGVRGGGRDGGGTGRLAKRAERGA